MRSNRAKEEAKLPTTFSIEGFGTLCKIYTELQAEQQLRDSMVERVAAAVDAISKRERQVRSTDVGLTTALMPPSCMPSGNSSPA